MIQKKLVVSQRIQSLQQEKGTSFVELAISLPLLTFLFLSIAQANFYVASQLDAKVIQTNLATVPLGSGGRIENGAYVADVELEEKESNKIRDSIVQQLADLGYQSEDYQVSVNSALLPIATEAEAPAGGSLTFLGPDDTASVRSPVNAGNCSSCDDQNWTDAPDHLAPGAITRIGVDTTFVRMNSDDIPRYSTFAIAKRGQVADETVYLYEISIKPQGIASAIPFLNGAVSVKGALLPSKAAGRNAAAGNLATAMRGGGGGSPSTAREVTFVTVASEDNGAARNESDTMAMGVKSMYNAGSETSFMVNLDGSAQGSQQYVCDSSAPTAIIANEFGIPDEDKPNTWYGDSGTSGNLPPPTRSAFIVVDVPKGGSNPCTGIDFSDIALDKAESYLTKHETKETPIKEDYTKPAPDAPVGGGEETPGLGDGGSDTLPSDPDSGGGPCSLAGSNNPDKSPWLTNQTAAPGSCFDVRQ